MVNPGTNFKFAFVADFKGGTTVHDAISSLIATAAPRFSLYGGDLCNTSDSDTFRREFFRAPELVLSSSVPFFNSTGNHESWGQTTQAFTQGPDSSSGVQGYYSFDCGDVHFVNVNDYISYGVGSAQYNWVASDLAASTKPWKVVWCHNPPYTSTSDGHGEDSGMKTMATNLFEPNHVDVVFNGHNHFYQHNLVNGINYMIVGSAGADALYSHHRVVHHLLVEDLLLRDNQRDAHDLQLHRLQRFRRCAGDIEPHQAIHDIGLGENLRRRWNL